MKTRLVAREELPDEHLAEMLGLFSAHFASVDREAFLKDLEEKNYVLLLRDEDDGSLKGFSTIHIYETTFEGEDLTIIFSGDTIMDPSAWGSPILSKAWCASMAKLRESYTRGRFYWLLISSGYRTYRFLPVFWREYFPRHDAETPPKLQAMMHALARERFGDQYDEATGVVQLTSPQVLKPELRGIPEERMRDPRIRFFDERNPGHERGDELVCLTEVSEENMTRACRRVWFSGTEV